MKVNVAMSNPGTASTIDPYAEIEVRRDFEGAFKPGFYLKMYFLFVSIAIVGVGLASFVSFTRAEYVPAIYALLFSFFLEWAVIRKVPCYLYVAPRGLEIRYLFLKKPTWLDWSQIRSLKISQGRGTWGELRTQEGVYYLALEPSGFEDARVLVKLITKNANLNFVRGKAFNDAYYTRVENNSADLFA